MSKKFIFIQQNINKNIKSSGCYIINRDNIDDIFYNTEYHRIIFDDSIDDKFKNIDLLKKIKAKKMVYYK